MNTVSAAVGILRQRERVAGRRRTDAAGCRIIVHERIDVGSEARQEVGLDVCLVVERTVFVGDDVAVEIDTDLQRVGHTVDGDRDLVLRGQVVEEDRVLLVFRKAGAFRTERGHEVFGIAVLAEADVRTENRIVVAMLAVGTIFEAV